MQVFMVLMGVLMYVVAVFVYVTAPTITQELFAAILFVGGTLSVGLGSVIGHLAAGAFSEAVRQEQHKAKSAADVFREGVRVRPIRSAALSSSAKSAADVRIAEHNARLAAGQKAAQDEQAARMRKRRRGEG